MNSQEKRVGNAPLKLSLSARPCVVSAVVRPSNRYTASMHDGGFAVML